jgi:hypothetical protein
MGQEKAVAQIRSTYEEIGLQAPAMMWDALWMRVHKHVRPADLNEYISFLVALLTDYRRQFCRHIEYRMQHQGNVHIACRGPTGSGKSSCMITIMDWIKPIPKDGLCDRLAFDIHEIPRKLAKLTAGDTVLLDELVAVAGEGARTNQMLLKNMEDTLRASQRNLIVASPAEREHSTMQVDLECIAWDPAKKYSLFLVWVEGKPVGVLPVPWCSQDLYDQYQPWKEENVKRTLAGQFKDNEQTAKAVMALFDDSRFTEYLWLGVNKPKMTDFNTAITLFAQGMLSQAQVERMAKFAHDQCYAYQRVAEKFEFFFGVPANAGFKKIASKCYEE